MNVKCEHKLYKNNKFVKSLRLKGGGGGRITFFLLTVALLHLVDLQVLNCTRPIFCSFQVCLVSRKENFNFKIQKEAIFPPPFHIPTEQQRAFFYPKNVILELSTSRPCVSDKLQTKFHPGKVRLVPVPVFWLTSKNQTFCYFILIYMANNLTFNLNGLRQKWSLTTHKKNGFLFLCVVKNVYFFSAKINKQYEGNLNL